MSGSLAEVIGVPLDEEEYLDDFWPRFQKARGICWKLERRPVGEIAGMYDHAEDFRPFFAREVAILPPPAVTWANSGG
ncbi:hypothetical protein CC117_17275 [Parafrankia colletiae]|uniref:Uncharacterized protein n=1 Tax=Parafrankia colletiae TaxID=573497 RepID=A0A1S1QPK0_9ACTN|nr:hypothetical protein [Parafrankia colletiae]MCK9903656.1 hypothetical protein [Frankia sp. Cpl3]OHV36653.1 hypothetical protein CC117_17275 [Parafrankia colletiae]